MADGRISWRPHRRRMAPGPGADLGQVEVVPAPPTGAHYDSLRPIMDVPGGIDGEVEAYMLGLGGLDAQVQILENNGQERRTVCEKAGLGGTQQSNDNDK